MRPSIAQPMSIRGVAFGGSQPLFCIPLVAKDTEDLLTQARTAKQMRPDVIEWRSDAFHDDSVESFTTAASELRLVFPDVPVLFTLRSAHEGGMNKAIAQEQRQLCIEDLLRGRTIDLIDIELRNDPAFLTSVVETAHQNNVRVVLSFHDFQATPGNEALLAAVAAMVEAQADIAKLACMPQGPNDVLRLLSVTVNLRERYPGLPLCITSMGKLGAISRVAGFLYGSDMAFAVGTHASAPGQIPIAEARAMTKSLLRYSGGLPETQ